MRLDDDGKAQEKDTLSTRKSLGDADAVWFFGSWSHLVDLFLHLLEEGLGLVFRLVHGVIHVVEGGNASE